MSLNARKLQANFFQTISVLTPVQRAYIATTILHNSLGLFESFVIWQNRFASVNTLVFYLTSALVALVQILFEIHVKPTAPYSLTIFVGVFLANCVYLLVCLIRAREKHTAWVCLTFLVLFFGICHAVHINQLQVGDRAHFFRILLFVTTLANNFVPFDSLLAIVSARGRQCPPQFIPLVTGLLQSVFGGLFRHRLHEALMAPADALGVAVHLFGLVVEMNSLLIRR